MLGNVEVLSLTFNAKWNTYAIVTYWFTISRVYEIVFWSANLTKKKISTTTMKPLGLTLLQKQINRRVYKSCGTSCFNLTGNKLTLVFKVGPSPSKENCVICLTESPLKMMKNVFYFVLKAFFILKIFKFLP